MAGIRDIVDNLFGPGPKPVVRAPVAPQPAGPPSPEFTDLMQRLKNVQAPPTQESAPVPREKPQQVTSAPSPIMDIVREAALEVGVDPDFLIAKGFMESSLNPNARAKTTSAQGLFQFTEGTWKDMVKRHGGEYGITEKDINDPRAQAILAAQYQKNNEAALKRRLGENFNARPLDLYMTHFLGPTGGATFIEKALKNPNAKAARDFKGAAKRNRSIFFDEDGKARTYKEVAGMIREKIKRAREETGIGSIR